MAQSTEEKNRVRREHYRLHGHVILDRHRAYRLTESGKLVTWKASLRKYGLTPQDYLDMLNRQNGVCKVCKVPKSSSGRRLHIDHCHTTGRVRGLLCDKCNQCLGNVKDNPERLEALAAYLRQV